MTTIPWTPEDSEARRLLDERIDSYDVDPTTMTLWERIIEWLNDALALNVDATGTGSVVIQVLLVAAVAVLLFLLIRYFRPSVSPNGQDEANQLVDHSIAAEQYLGNAQRHLAASRLDQAYLEAYRYMVRTASQRELVEVVPATTATTFGWSLGAVMPTYRTAIADASTEFNSIIYGGNVPTRKAAETMIQLAQTIATAQPKTADRHDDPARLIPR